MTLMVNVHVLVKPMASLAVYVTSMLPIGNRLPGNALAGVTCTRRVLPFNKIDIVLINNVM